MAYNPQTNQLSVLGTNAKSQNGLYDIWIWGISRWGKDGIISPMKPHTNCVVNAYNTTFGDVRNIFTNGESQYWTGDGPIVITYPYSWRIKDVGINSSNGTFSLYGSNATTPSLPIKEDFIVDDLASGDFTNCILSGDAVTLDGAIGGWISPIYELSPTSILSFNYSESKPSGTDVRFYFRTSFDGYNWTPWTLNKQEIDATLSIGELQKTSLFRGSLYITGASNAYIYADQYVSGTINIYGTASGDDFYRYKIQIGDGVAPDTWTDITAWITSPVTDNVLCSYDTSNETDGYYTFRIIVEDATAQGPQTSTDTVLCVIDNTNPDVTLDYPTQYLAGVMDILGDVSDDNIKEWALYFYADGGSATENNRIVISQSATSGVLLESFDTTDYVDGVYNIEIRAWDKAGNSTVLVEEVTVDQSYPSILRVQMSPTIFSGTRHGQVEIDYLFSSAGTMTIDVYDGDNVLAANICTDEVVSASGTKTWDGSTLEDAEYSVLVQFTASGNTVQTYTTDNLIICTTDLSCSITAPTTGANVSKFVEIEGSATDLYFDYYELQYSDDNTNWITYKTNDTSVTDRYLGAIYFPTTGTYYVRCVIYDTIGESAVSNVVTINVMDMPDADIYLGYINVDLTPGTLFIPNIDLTPGVMVINGVEQLIGGTMTIRTAELIPGTMTINSISSYDIDQIQPRNYIQIKIEMKRDASQTVSVQNMSFTYSDDWFVVAENISNNGANVYKLYSEELKHLAIDVHQTTTIYEFIETHKI